MDPRAHEGSKKRGVVDLTTDGDDSDDSYGSSDDDVQLVMPMTSSSSSTRGASLARHPPSGASSFASSATHAASAFTSAFDPAVKTSEGGRGHESKKKRRRVTPTEEYEIYSRQDSTSDNYTSKADDDDSDVELVERRNTSQGRLKDDSAYEDAAKSGGLPKDDYAYWYNTSSESNGASFDGVVDGCLQSDYELAAALQRQEEREAAEQRDLDESAKLAAQLQREEEDELAKHAKAKEEETKAMQSSTSGRAVLFVQEILKAHEELKSSARDASIEDKISAVARDDMVSLAERMLELQQAFRVGFKPSHVDIGFHYTTPQNLDNIRTNGLMTSADRQANKVVATPRGAVFGDGIYTGNNPFCFQNFGTVGLLVARLRGDVEEVSYPPTSRKVGSGNADTVIGNKQSRNRTLGADIAYYNEVVLRQSSQCVPIARFCSSLTRSTLNRANGIGNAIVYGYHSALQAVVDSFFNKGQPTEVKAYLTPPTGSAMMPAAAAMPAAFPAAAAVGAPAGSIMPAMASALSSSTSASVSAMVAGVMGSATRGHRGRHSRLNTQASSSSPEVLNYVAPLRLNPPTCAYELVRTPQTGATCTICLDPLSSQRAVKINKCGHQFHKACINQSLSLTGKSTCPVCRKNVGGEPQGAMPSGKMTITRSSIQCQGHQGYGSIVIDYQIPSGVQLSYMSNPGQRFTGATRKAYLPNTLEGRRLLKRLKYAFTKGLTFTIGTSLTSGQKNVVTWSSIHHKTNTSGGSSAYGYPDAGYFHNANEELDNLQVPPADDC